MEENRMKVSFEELLNIRMKAVGRDSKVLLRSSPALSQLRGLGGEWMTHGLLGLVFSKATYPIFCIDSFVDTRMREDMKPGRDEYVGKCTILFDTLYKIGATDDDTGFLSSPLLYRFYRIYDGCLRTDTFKEAPKFFTAGDYSLRVMRGTYDDLYETAKLIPPNRIEFTEKVFGV